MLDNNDNLIIIDVRTIDWTGIGRVTKGIIETSKSNPRVKFITNRKIDGIKSENLIYFKSNPFSFLEQVEYCLLFRKLVGYHIIFHSLNFNIPLILPNNTFSVVHFYEVLANTGEFNNIFKKIFYNIYMLAIRYYSSSVLAQSEFTKKQLKDIHNINNVIVCPHGFVPLQHQNYISDPLFNSKYIFYSGLNRPRKNLIGLLRAYRKFINQNSENKFDLVMSGPDFLAHGQSEIHDYIEKHSELKNRVHLLGFVDENTLSKLYKDASLLVMPSHLEGGYSYPALEALASGTPVLLNFYDMYGYNKGPGIYFFNQPNNPNFSNLTQALITLLNSNINKISPENHPLLNDFSWENVKTIINDVYSSRC